MNSSLPIATYLTGDDYVELRAIADESLNGVVVRRGIIDSRALTIRRNETLECKLYHSKLGNPVITRDNPFLSEDDLASLDSLGIVRIGTVVEAGKTAVSVLETVVTSKKARPGFRWVQNGSSRFPVELAGYEVSNVVRENIHEHPSDFEPRMIDRIKIELIRIDNISIGDRVVINDQDISIIEVFNDDEMPTSLNGNPIDLLIPATKHFPEGTEHRVSVRRSLPTASDVVQKRSAGNYSLISLQPLNTGNISSQRVSASQIYWLKQNGFIHLAGEFASLKCDETTNRSALQELDRGERNLALDVEIGAPESLFLILEHLRVLGIDVSCKQRTGYLSLQMKPATNEFIKSVAPAQITRPETVNYRTYLPEQGGLFCEKAFGPESGSRRRTPAHILLNHAVLPPIFRIGKEPILSKFLAIDSETVEAIVDHRLGLNAEDKLVEIDQNSELTTGANAIEILIANQRVKRFKWEPLNMVQNFVYVLPPDLRPLVMLSNGSFATSDLNGLYRDVISRNNRLGKLRELNAPQVILNSEMRELQSTVDQLHANGQFHLPIVGDNGAALMSAFDMLLTHLSDPAPKKQDWSGSARTIVDPNYPVDKCCLPKSIFETLRCAESDPILLTVGEAFIACYPTCADEPVIRIGQAIATKLSICNGQVSSVHRPLTRLGVREAESMVERQSYIDFDEVAPISKRWCVEPLVEHIWTEQELPMDLPGWLLIGGTGGTAFASDVELPKAQRELIEVPVTKSEPATELQLVELIESFEKTSIVFALAPTETEPEPNEGRFGGVPWLPEGTQWPFHDGVPVPFLAQLPLASDIPISLPFQVAPNSLLTIFWSDDWWEPKATSSPCLLIHSANDLVLADLPAGVELRKLHRLKREVKAQLPSYSEYAESLYVHYENIPTRLLEQLRERYEVDIRAVGEESRVGGIAYWIQSPRDAFIAQIVSNDAWQIEDGGCLYISGESPQSLTAWVDSY